MTASHGEMEPAFEGTAVAAGSEPTVDGDGRVAGRPKPINVGLNRLPATNQPPTVSLSPRTAASRGCA